MPTDATINFVCAAAFAVAKIMQQVVKQNETQVEKKICHRSRRLFSSKIKRYCIGMYVLTVHSQQTSTSLSHRRENPWHYMPPLANYLRNRYKNYYIMFHVASYVVTKFCRFHNSESSISDC